MDIIKRKKLKLFYFIQLPPPVHGVSVMNNLVFSSNTINKSFAKYLLKIKFSDHFYQLRKFTFRKIFVFFKLCFLLIVKIATIKPDIIYFSFMPVGRGFYRDAFFLAIMKLFRNKIIIHLHNRGINKQASAKINKWFYQKLFSNLHIIHLSEGILKEEFLGLKLSNTFFHVIPNCLGNIDPSKYKTYSQKDSLNLLFLSNLIKEKGVFDLLNVYKDLILRYPNLHLNIIGAPHEENEMKLIKILRDSKILSEKVTYFGPLFGDEKYQVFAESDIFVFPSYFSEESMPLVILEAMQFGLPIISSNLGAIPEILKNNRNAILYESKNNIELKNAIEYLVNQQEIRLALGKNAKDEFNMFYTLDKFEKNMQKLFCDVISK